MKLDPSQIKCLKNFDRSKQRHVSTRWDSKNSSASHVRNLVGKGFVGAQTESRGFFELAVATTTQRLVRYATYRLCGWISPAILHECAQVWHIFGTIRKPAPPVVKISGRRLYNATLPILRPSAKIDVGCKKTLVSALGYSSIRHLTIRWNTSHNVSSKGPTTCSGFTGGLWV